jgi:hypothetical protein
MNHIAVSLFILFPCAGVSESISLGVAHWQFTGSVSLWLCSTLSLQSSPKAGIWYYDDPSVLSKLDNNSIVTLVIMFWANLIITPCDIFKLQLKRLACRCKIDPAYDRTLLFYQTHKKLKSIAVSNILPYFNFCVCELSTMLDLEIWRYVKCM